MKAATARPINPEAKNHARLERRRAARDAQREAIEPPRFIDAELAHTLFCRAFPRRPK